MRFLIFLLLPLMMQAQVYPYSENFNSQPSGAPPTNWSGDMNVLLAHGVNDTKALAEKMSAINLSASAVTPEIGPLTGSSALFLKYRFVEDFIYPSTEAHLRGGSKLTIATTTNGFTFTLLYTIDSLNHVSTLNFTSLKVPLTDVTGSIRIGFQSSFGSGTAYYVDVDDVEVKDDPEIGIQESETDAAFRVFPNPVSAGQSFQIDCDPSLKSSPVEVYDARGRFVQRSAIDNMNALPAGSYFVRLGHYCRKLIVLP